MSDRVLIWVQHLLGFGHFARARAVSEALRDAGFRVTLVSGGFTPANAVPTGIDFVQLPPGRAKDELFDELLDERGEVTTPQWHEERRRVLVSAFDRANPDVLITETFPFGRRLVEFELLGLLDVAEHSLKRPKVICSVRDVLQRPRKSDRAVTMVDRVRRSYDAVMVHGDPNLIRLEESFPEVERVADRCRYTGYICKTMPMPQGERREILVSAGGGAAGGNLMATAAQARIYSKLQSRPWTFVTGPLAESAILAYSTDQTVVRELPDFSSRLAGAALSISQGGYNTVMETVAARTPAIVVPFETDREQEQTTRARLFENLGQIRVMRRGELEARALARLIDEAANSAVPEHSIDLSGREGTVRVVREVLSQ